MPKTKNKILREYAVVCKNLFLQKNDLKNSPSFPQKADFISVTAAHRNSIFLCLCIPGETPGKIFDLTSKKTKCENLDNNLSNKLTPCPAKQI